MSLPEPRTSPYRESVRAGTRAVLFDAGHTLLEMDYTEVQSFFLSRGHRFDDAALVAAERRARIRLEEERARQATPGRTGEGRYARYILDHLAITDAGERSAFTEWRRSFNAPIGLCRRADAGATQALRKAREAGCVVGVISNSNGSVQRALGIAGLAPFLDFVIDSSVVGMAKPDPRIFALGLAAARTTAADTLYVGDSYFVDVVGTRRAGLAAVLFDPGSLWGRRDCFIATSLEAAVGHAVERSEF